MRFITVSRMWWSSAAIWVAGSALHAYGGSWWLFAVSMAASALNAFIAWRCSR